MARKPKTSGKDTADRPGHGVVVRAANGDVIRYDPSGLVMRLSDTVIADIALRLGTDTTAPAPATVAIDGTAAPRATERADPHDLLEGIDAWDLRIEDDWLIFNARLPGEQGVRAFRRHRDGGHVIADAPGPMMGILGLGGPRAALANDATAAFPQHIVAPADDIGAVGHAGVEPARETPHLEHLREMTHEALTAETLLTWQLEKFGPLPLFLTRAETDSAASAAELAAGMAFDNMLAAARNLVLAAASLGKRAKLAAVCLDYALEDVTSDATGYRDGMLALMGRAEEELGRLGFHHPLFVTRFECGTPAITEGRTIEGQWDLVWNHAAHRLIFSAPSYMFAVDETDRATEQARREMAEMTACAISDPDGWRCPTFYLAERETPDGAAIRVIAQSASDLIIDPADPLGAGDAAGFRLIGAENGARITGVAVSDDDPKALIVTCDKPPTGAALRLAYAFGAEAGEGPYPANRGAVRDEWQMVSATGRMLYRFALPALLPITQGGGHA